MSCVSGESPTVRVFALGTKSVLMPLESSGLGWTLVGIWRTTKATPPLLVALAKQAWVRDRVYPIDEVHAGGT